MHIVKRFVVWASLEQASDLEGGVIRILATVSQLAVPTLESSLNTGVSSTLAMVVGGFWDQA